MTESMPELSRLGIGKVIDELRAEFPELSITKIRYLESEGLIAPERTPSGYRKFSYRDVERLRFILRQQRDTFKPLRTIRQLLEDMDRGVVPQDAINGQISVPRTTLGDDGLPTPATFTEGRSQIRLSRAELLDAADISGELLEALEQYGLIKRRPNQSYYDGHALSVAAVVREFSSLGLEPRHLKIFRSAADREIGLFDQLVAPVAKQHDKAKTAEITGTIAALAIRLHTILVQDGLSS